MEKQFKFWLFIFLLTCLNELCVAQTNVWISGKLLTDNGKGTAEINNDVFLFFPRKNLATAQIDKNDNFNLKLHISEPQVIKFFNVSLFISPGDSVFMKFTGSRFGHDKIEFTGRNANQYIYEMKYDSLKRSFRFKPYQYEFKNGLTNYLEGISANKSSLLNYLEGFVKNQKLSVSFMSFARSQINYEYYDQLLYPIVNNKFPIEELPSSYTSLIDQIKLTDNYLADKREYAFTALHLITYKKMKSNENELKLIQDYSTGLTKDYLLTYYASQLINSYSSKDSASTKTLFEMISKGIESAEYKNYFKAYNDQLIKCITPFPKQVLLTALMDSVGNRLTFKDLLTKYKNKILVLDFWASWCGGCIEGMPKVKKLQKDLNSPEIGFVFISIDETMKNWRSGLAHTKIPGNHYWISENFKSALVKYMIIPTIPRYVIINREGKIEKMNSTGPSLGNFGLQEQLAKLLNN